MSRFRLSNQIFHLGLDAQELTVYAYLCSLPTDHYTLDGAATVKVRQTTIALRCGIRSVKTVARVIERLQVLSLVEPLGRALKANHRRGTYRYAVQQLDQTGGYFLVERRVFGTLTPRQMLIYLYICKSYSTALHICWNSYQDMAAQTGMKRELVIRTVNELVAMHLIVRIRKRAKENNRMFVDNHYQVVFFVRGNIRKGKKTARLLWNSNRTMYWTKCPYHQFHHTTLLPKSQGLTRNFIPMRGSPSNASVCSVPTGLTY